MTPLPKRRHSTQRGGKRRAAILKSLKRVVLVKCPNCGQPKLPHQACLKCGQYHKVKIPIKTKKEKRDKRT